MNTNIRNADARRFWEAVWLEYAIRAIKHSGPIMDVVSEVADLALDDWAARFGTEDDLADIEANKARREIGNEP